MRREGLDLAAAAKVVVRAVYHVLRPATASVEVERVGLRRDVYGHEQTLVLALALEQQLFGLYRNLRIVAPRRRGDRACGTLRGQRPNP